MPAIALLAAIAGIAIAVRQRHPVLAFALLFFLAAHLVESSVLQLELYFEHRNYLPAAFLFWPVARWMLYSELTRKFRSLLVVGSVGVLLAMTVARASLWGDNARLAAVWAADNPGSARSQMAAARSLATHSPSISIERARAALQEHPRSVDVALELIALECASGSVSEASLQHARHVLATQRAWHEGVNNWFQTALTSDLPCSGLGLSELKSLIDALSTNPRHSSPRRTQNVMHLQGMLALAQKRPSDALSMFNRALAHRPDPVIALNQAAQLGNRGYLEEALQHLDQLDSYSWTEDNHTGMPKLHNWLLHSTGYFTREIDALRLALTRSIMEKQGENHTLNSRVPEGD